MCFWLTRNGWLNSPTQLPPEIASVLYRPPNPVAMTARVICRWKMM